MPQGALTAVTASLLVAEPGVRRGIHTVSGETASIRNCSVRPCIITFVCWRQVLLKDLRREKSRGSGMMMTATFGTCFGLREPRPRQGDALPRLRRLLVYPHQEVKSPFLLCAMELISVRRGGARSVWRYGQAACPPHSFSMTTRQVHGRGVASKLRWRALCGPRT